jgi:hypothetical protein
MVHEAVVAVRADAGVGGVGRRAVDAGRAPPDDGQVARRREAGQALAGVDLVELDPELGGRGVERELVGAGVGEHGPARRLAEVDAQSGWVECLSLHGGDKLPRAVVQEPFRFVIR